MFESLFMNIFKSILNYFKRLPSLLFRQSEEGSADEFLDDGLLRELIFDEVVMEEEVKMLNQRISTIDNQKSQIKPVTPSDFSQITKDIEHLEKMLQANASNQPPKSFSFKILETEVDDFFKNIRVVKKFKKREKKKKIEELASIQKIEEDLNILHQLISKDNLSGARRIVTQIELAIRSLRKSDTRKKLVKTLAKRVDTLTTKEKKIRQQKAEQKRLAEEAKEREEQKRKEQEEISRRKREEKKKKAAAAKEQKLQDLLQKKSNWKDFEKILRENQITTLYHFTDRANLASIKKKGGLYSWDYCEKDGISISTPGGDPLSRDLDTRQGLRDYVRLSFIEDHPMMFVAKRDNRIQNPVILEISTEVAFLKGTRFSNMNAADGKHQNRDSADFLKGLKFELFNQSYFNLDTMDKKYYQAEIMVRTWIPLKYITNINNF